MALSTVAKQFGLTMCFAIFSDTASCPVNWPKEESRPSKINVVCSLQASKIQSETKHNQLRRRHLPIVHQFRFTADTLQQEISSKDLVC